MANNPTTRRETAIQILGSLHKYTSLADASRALFETLDGEFSSEEAAKSYLRRLKGSVLTDDDQKKTDTKTGNEVDYEENPSKGSAKFEFKGSVDKPITVEELIESHGVDQDEWEISKIKVRAWGITTKIKQYKQTESADGKVASIPVGQHLEAGKNYYIAVDLARKVQTADTLLDDSMDRIINSVKAIASNRKVTSRTPFRLDGSIKMSDDTKRKSEADKRMLEVSLFDLHLGKLCWGEETGGADWDTRIASSATLGAAKDLLDFFPSYGQIWLPLGHDFFNSDGPGDNGSGGRTTRGTSQDEDSRWAASYDTGVDVALSLVEMCLQYAPVDITIMRGNHDEQRCVALGRLLKEVYRDHPYVTVDDSKGRLKAYQWGDNFLATAHGQLEKEQKIITECALKFPKEFSGAKWREVHVGHGHRMRNAAMTLEGWEEQSVRYRMIPSLCSPDAWHADNLYHNLPAAECYLWDKEDLYLGHHSCSKLP